MHVREATVEDIASIRQVAAAAWRVAYRESIPEEAIEAGVEHWYSDPVVRMELSNPGTEIRVAETEGSIVGFVHANTSGPVPTILRLHADPAHRAAESALFEAIEAAIDADDGGLRATVLEANEHVRQFYEEQGFELVDMERTTIGEEQYPESIFERA